MTDKQYQILNKYHKFLYTSFYSDYCSLLLGKDLDVLLGIYKELFNSNYNLCRHCSSSVLNMMKRIAKEYFDYGENLQIQNRRTDTDRKRKKTKKG